MMERMRECPFCGREVKLYAGIIAGLPMIVCSNCNATVSFGGKETPKQAKDAWNRRAKYEKP